jgi:hypothetical protein
MQERAVGGSDMMRRKVFWMLTAAGLTLAAPAPAQTAAGAGAVLASAQYSADPDLRCELLEVRRVSGGGLTIRWRIVNTAGQAGGLTASTPKQINYDFSWQELYFIDPAENKKYEFLTDSAGNRILDVFYGNLAAGQQRLNWAKFPAPPPSSTKISISIPKFAPFEDIPVAQ